MSTPSLTKGEDRLPSRSASPHPFGRMTKRGQEVVATFTARESMVAAFVATGMEYKEAARILGMSRQMIKNTCQILFDKTGTDNRLRLVLFLIDQGIIQKPMRLPI